jgi:hypothetical protein
MQVRQEMATIAVLVRRRELEQTGQDTAPAQVFGRNPENCYKTAHALAADVGKGTGPGIYRSHGVSGDADPTDGEKAGLQSVRRRKQ